MMRLEREADLSLIARCFTVERRKWDNEFHIKVTILFVKLEKYEMIVRSWHIPKIVMFRHA